MWEQSIQNQSTSFSIKYNAIVLQDSALHDRTAQFTKKLDQSSFATLAEEQRKHEHVIVSYSDLWYITTIQVEVLNAGKTPENTWDSTDVMMSLSVLSQKEQMREMRTILWIRQIRFSLQSVWIVFKVVIHNSDVTVPCVHQEHTE